MLRFKKERGSIDFGVKKKSTMVSITSEESESTIMLTAFLDDEEMKELLDFLRIRLGDRINKKNK